MPEKTKKKTRKTNKKPAIDTKKEKKEKDKESKKSSEPTDDTDKIDAVTNKESMSPLTKTVIALIIIAIAIFMITTFHNTVEIKGQQDKCKEIESDPNLNFECICMALEDTEDKEKDIVEQKTTPLCRCTCDIGNGTLWTTDVRVSE